PSPRATTFETWTPSSPHFPRKFQRENWQVVPPYLRVYQTSTRSGKEAPLAPPAETRSTSVGMLLLRLPQMARQEGNDFVHSALRRRLGGRLRVRRRLRSRRTATLQRVDAKRELVEHVH